MTAIAEIKQPAARIERADLAAPILFPIGRAGLGFRAGTVIEIDGRTHAFEDDTPIALDGLTPGRDYGVGIDETGRIFAALVEGHPVDAGYVAGFHHTQGLNADVRAGNALTPAIAPDSLWDLDFRPSCDPRGMVRDKRTQIWVDSYMLATDHRLGTSRCGAVIATGSNLPDRPDGKGKVKKLDYQTAVEIYASHGKRLLTAEEFFSAAYGVKERCSRSERPERTGELTDGAERFISEIDLFDATGTMWQWGTDGHPDDPRPSLFGGSWVNGSSAGSRCASLDYWPGRSDENLSARGACDHL